MEYTFIFWHNKHKIIKKDEANLVSKIIVNYAQLFHAELQEIRSILISCNNNIQEFPTTDSYSDNENTFRLTLDRTLDN